MIWWYWFRLRPSDQRIGTHQSHLTVQPSLEDSTWFKGLDMIIFIYIFTHPTEGSSSSFSTNQKNQNLYLTKGYSCAVLHPQSPLLLGPVFIRDISTPEEITSRRQGSSLIASTTQRILPSVPMASPVEQEAIIASSKSEAPISQEANFGRIHSEYSTHLLLSGLLVAYTLGSCPTSQYFLLALQNPVESIQQTSWNGERITLILLTQSIPAGSVGVFRGKSQADSDKCHPCHLIR